MGDPRATCTTPKPEGQGLVTAMHLRQLKNTMEVNYLTLNHLLALLQLQQRFNELSPLPTPTITTPALAVVDAGAS
jgi:hypothetical protein